jgi:catechol 2,3-dioxygenase-like lactoylglutathione lyase family enzyme
MNSDNPTFALSELGQIGLTVRGIEKSVAFYRDKLELKHLFSAPPGLAFFRDPDGNLLALMCEKRG